MFWSPYHPVEVHQTEIRLVHVDNTLLRLDELQVGESPLLTKY